MALTPTSPPPTRKFLLSDYGTKLNTENLYDIVERIKCLRRAAIANLDGIAIFDHFGILKSVLTRQEIKTGEEAKIHYEKIVRVVEKQKCLMEELNRQFEGAKDLHQHVMNLRRLQMESDHQKDLYHAKKIAYQVYYSLSLLNDPNALSTSETPYFDIESHFAKKILLGTTTVEKDKKVKIYGKVRQEGTVEISLESDQIVQLFFQRCWSIDVIAETSFFSEKSPELPDRSFKGKLLHAELVQKEVANVELAQRAIQLAVEIFSKEDYVKFHLSASEADHILALKSAGFCKVQNENIKDLFQNPARQSTTFYLMKSKECPGTGFVTKKKNRGKSISYLPALIQIDKKTKMTWEIFIKENRILPENGETPIPPYLFRNLYYHHKIL